MKKKMAMMCMAGVMAVSLCACGNKGKETTADATATGIKSTTSSSSKLCTTSKRFNNNEYSKPTTANASSTKNSNYATTIINVNICKKIDLLPIFFLIML